MSIDTALYTLVTSVGGVDRLYPPPIPDNPTYPLVTYMQISGPRSYHQQGADGLVFARFEFDSWDLVSSGARELAEEVRYVLSGFKGFSDSIDILSVFLISEQKMFEDDTKVHRVSQDYRVTYREAITTTT